LPPATATAATAASSAASASSTTCHRHRPFHPCHSHVHAPNIKPNIETVYVGIVSNRWTSKGEFSWLVD
jgi:hypothetical protein